MGLWPIYEMKNINLSFAPHTNNATNKQKKTNEQRKTERKGLPCSCMDHFMLQRKKLDLGKVDAMIRYYL
jgi:hypothetical protein